mmetsp:Transcript_20244/g.44025  ORF Transcript_20244/g.44025 Transcript_20244/m.44025 type:complete len:245 (+) Transcript_20244:446-1180(+)
MNLNKKKKLLLDLTCCSIPLKEPTPQDISESLSRQSPVMSRALFEYNIRTLCGTCECAGNCHYCNERLLHEMADWAVMPDEKDKENIKVSTERKNSGTFPDLFHFHGKLAFVAPATEGGIMAAPFVCTTNTPAAEVQRFEEYMASGLVLDASAAQYAICRKIYSLSLLVKLFDEYQVKVRRTLPINPMERLTGCRHCNHSCQEGSSKQCSVCKASWFCCDGCMVAAGHKRCPLNQECESKAIFN